MSKKYWACKKGRLGKHHPWPDNSSKNKEELLKCENIFQSFMDFFYHAFEQEYCVHQDSHLCNWKSVYNMRK